MNGARRRICTVTGLLSLAALAVGCSKAQSTSASPGRADAAMPSEAVAGSELSDDAFGVTASLDDLEAEYAQVDAALSEAGVVNTLSYAPKPAPSSKPAAAEEPEKRAASEAESSNRCERICELQVSICDLSERICVLAESHEGEERYAKACSGASARCEQAQGACEACGND